MNKFKHPRLAVLVLAAVAALLLTRPGLVLAEKGAGDAAGAVKKLTLRQAIDLAMENNLELKLLAEDLKFRELDRDKAEYFSDQQRSAEEKINDGYRELEKKRADFEKVKNLLDPTAREAMQGQLDAAAKELEAASRYRTDTLEEAQVAELIQEKARVGVAVTALAEKLARKKIALLTQKSYYDILKAKRLVTVKEAALRRAQSQLKLAQAGFQQGMRAKDDYLLARSQVDLMQADLEKAKNSLANSEIELKKVLNLPGDTEIETVDDFTATPWKADLEQALKEGLSKRLEIRKAGMELDVARINLELAKRYSTPNTFAYREARLTVEKAEIELARQKTVVDADIRQAFSTLNATRSMLGYIENTQKLARESMDIATLRYREGYGLPGSIMKGLHAEDAAGTILEVLAAQEKLAEIEEKLTDIIYSYNLARANYLISTGDGL